MLLKLLFVSLAMPLISRFRSEDILSEACASLPIVFVVSREHVFYLLVNVYFYLTMYTFAL